MNDWLSQSDTEVASLTSGWGLRLTEWSSRSGTGWKGDLLEDNLRPVFTLMSSSPRGVPICLISTLQFLTGLGVPTVQRKVMLTLSHHSFLITQIYHYVHWDFSPNSWVQVTLFWVFNTYPDNKYGFKWYMLFQINFLACFQLNHAISQNYK